MTDKVQSALRSIIEKFESGNIPEAIAFSILPMANVPSAKWSFLNRTIMFFSGTQDARGFRQWTEVGRHVKKGSKAIIILAPRFAKTSTNQKTEEEEKKILTGFLAIPVFRVEDTEGEKLDYEQIELLDLPLIKVAESWGISVKAIPGNYRYLGYFCPGRQEIALASKEESVFFHELAHAAHHKILGDLPKGQNWKEEIVAELAAAALCNLVGKTSKFLGSNYQYIERYAKDAHLTAIQGCLRVINDVENVLNLILHTTIQENFSFFDAPKTAVASVSGPC